MYLKVVELVGFKSFADRTVLHFEPGMTAIVGPNGCGKSNVSDAIRWVLGEQSAKALRGSKMEDCIFNGSDSRKPLGMAEVSITFSDCESVLGTDFNEVTVTRRVFRSGEGQYFLNKTLCRLKDVQRLFMDTGIGTSAYSVMEQGRIDQVLSSRPEDRRTIFEEASGITKFKADKAEAIRKLEHTEANLLRLADVIREVRRQIGSLQRQAGKAQRYRALRNELRGLDIYATRERLRGLEEDIRRMESETADLAARIRAAKAETEEREQAGALLRRAILQTEKELEAAIRGEAEAKGKSENTRERIALNRQRVEEHVTWSRRHAQEIEDARAQAETQRRALADLAAALDTARAGRDATANTVEKTRENVSSRRQQTETLRREIHDLQVESVELESRTAKLQNERLQADTRDRSGAIQRERLLAEQGQLESVARNFEKRQAEADQTLREAAEQVAAATANLDALRRQQDAGENDLARAQTSLADARARMSAASAQAEHLADPEPAFPPGARLLLDPANPLGVRPETILGPLAGHVEVPPDCQAAFDAALRGWTDALVVTDLRAAAAILAALETARPGPARLLALRADDDGPAAPVSGNGAIPLRDRAKCSDAARPLVERILKGVFLVDSPDHVPVPVPAGCTFVTRNGSALRADGGAAFGADGSSPSAARQTREELQKEIAALSARIAEGEASAGKARSERDDLRSRLAQAQSEREKRMHESAVLEGQASVMARECRQSRERLNTVAWELQNLAVETEQGTERKASLDAEIGQIAALREQRSREIQERNTRLRDAENELAAAQSEWTEQSVRFAQVRQEADHLESRHGAAKSRIEELDGIILARADSVRASESSIGDLREAIRQAESDLAEQQRHAAAMVAEADVLRGKREKQTEEMETLVQTLSRDRETLDELRSRRSEIEVKHSESLMRRQSQLDRIASDYNLTAEQLAGEPEPAWGAEKPATEAIETAIAELRTKLEAMGPVNLVAIEEHRQLEERCAFLSQQEQDLVNAKQQLLEMIRKINRTTSEMFRSTFAAINENFVNTFRKLFNGGSARLVLVNEEDVLECGIEIIARPPGKRLQNISLLSGGERTLTAVSLLFAIYMTKPSPFCMLDEMDAPLDDSNIGRFLRMVQDFLIQSQFVVITHNRQTISAAGTIYGVTMPEKGISKIVSMKFNRQQAEPAPAAPPSAPAPVPA